MSNAELTATTDRGATADMVLSAAMTTAVGLVADGYTSQAVWVLTRAGLRAERILGK